MQKALPKGWKMVRLGDIASNEKFSIRMGPFGSQLKKHELVNEGIKVLWIENIVNNEFRWLDNKCITSKKFEDLEGFQVRPNDILTTTMGTIGRTCVVPSDIGQAIISSHLLKISPNLTMVDPTFVAKYISSEVAQHYLDRNSHGIVMKGLNTSIIKKLPVPLPPLPTQHKIVEILEEASNLRNLRQQANGKMKDLIPSLFVEMFGDPAINPKGWEVKKLGESAYITKLAGFEFTKYVQYIDNGEIIAIRGINLKDGTLDLTDIKRIKKEVSDTLPRSKVFKDDILMTFVGSIGSVAIAPESNIFHLGPNVSKIRVQNTRLNVRFLHSFLKSFASKQVKKLSKTTSMGSISMQNIRQLFVPLPPLSLQQEFTKLVEDIETEKARQAESKKNLDELFNSLMQRAFTGQLAA
ncbi:MAG: restriction endonuclease subunit S [Thermodesulfovibrionales bacterium]